MNYDVAEIKALNFEHQIDLMWCNGDTEPMEQLLKMIDIPFDRSDLLDYGWILSDNFINKWGVDETIKKMKSFIPSNKEKLNAEFSEGQTCLNTECQFCHSNREPNCYTIYSDCWADIHIFIDIAIRIGGLSALKELKDKWGIDTEVLYQYYEDGKGLYEKELYEMNLPIKDIIQKHCRKIKNKGDDNMSKPFWTALSELKGEISVFWTANMMYVNDNNDGQASTNTTLFEAYRFTLLIQSPIFDYDATDKEVKDFQKELLEFYADDFSDEEQEQYIIDVWEYLDDIANDYYKLTGVNINDIDYKRAIVSYMSETDLENDCAMGYGSGTYIARLISDHIIGDDRHQVKRCDNPIAIKLADKYLKSDYYNLKEFAKALHKECEHKMSIPKNFNEYLIQSHNISEKCYYLLGQLIKNNREYKDDILVGYIDWFGDYEEYERYIYCHIDSEKNEIYFYENQDHKKSGYAFLHDIAFHHLVNDPSRIQEDIIIKFTTEYIDQIVKDKIYDIYGLKEEDNIYNGNDWGYNYCHMYCDTIGKYIE